MRRGRTAASLSLAVALAAAVAGCGYQEAPLAPKPAPVASGSLGAALPVSNSNSTQLEVTVTRVIDPAQGTDAYTAPAAGKHFVGVELSIRNTAATKYQNNANNETTATLASGRRLTAAYESIVGCQNFDNGQVTVSPGKSQAGCVTFQVPNGDRIAVVRYASATFPGTAAQWHLG